MFRLVIALTAAMAVFVPQAGAQSAGSLSAPPAAPAPLGAAGELVFIGANHAFAFLEPGFSPAHIRALLTKINPAAVLGELPPSWPRNDGIPTYPHEQYAAVTWAEEAGVPMYPVNWVPSILRERQPEVRMSDTAAVVVVSSPTFERFREDYLARAQFSASLAFGEDTNDIESYHRQYAPLVVPEWPMEDSVTAVREDSITAMTLQAMRRHPGQRVAMVYGMGHYATIKRRLEAVGVNVLPPQEYFPLSPEEIERGFLPDDAVVLLGSNLDDWRTIGMPQNSDHGRTRKLLDRLHLDRPNSVVGQYFEARWRMLLNHTDSATTILRGIVDEGGETTIPYVADPRWSWPPFRALEHKALFHLAALDDFRGDRSSAVERYNRLLALPEKDLLVPALSGGRRIDLRPYLRSFLEYPYRGGLLEAYRSELAQGRW